MNKIKLFFGISCLAMAIGAAAASRPAALDNIYYYYPDELEPACVATQDVICTATVGVGCKNTAGFQLYRTKPSPTSVLCTSPIYKP